MVSLWKVNDFSTSELMSEFYVQLTEKKRAMDESLLLSKMKLIQEKEYAHPFYWASFVLIGSN
jgi:CHAT domain-containing protein